MEPHNDFPAEIAEDKARNFVDNYFATIDRGHRSRDACFRRVAEQISRHPGGTLPDKLGSPARYAAMDRLMNRAETTHAALLAPHYAKTRQKMEACDGTVLVLHDTTLLDYSGLRAVRLARVGNGHGRGFLCHNSLAIDPQRHEVLGLVSQILHQRVSKGKKEPVAKKRSRASRESRLWSRAVQQVPAPLPGKRQIDIADRGGDLFEFLFQERQLGRECVVRSMHNRRVLVGHDGASPCVLLHDYLRSLPAVGAARTKEIHESNVHDPRAATLRVAHAAVTIVPPHVRQGDYEKEPILAWAVRVWEENAPEGATPLEWFLICLGAVATADDAWQACDWYSCRWMIEMFHPHYPSSDRLYHGRRAG